jgi:CheY-like chemotaxis protein
MQQNIVKKILMADDDEEDMELMEEAILAQKEPVELIKFSNGRTTLAYLQESADNELPCVILLDYSMPEMTGADVLSHIKKHARYLHIPKVVLSTSNAPLHMHECLASGATEYLVKPSSLKEYNKLAVKILSFC